MVKETSFFHFEGVLLTKKIADIERTRRLLPN